MDVFLSDVGTLRTNEHRRAFRGEGNPEETHFYLSSRSAPGGPLLHLEQSAGRGSVLSLSPTCTAPREKEI